MSTSERDNDEIEREIDSYYKWYKEASSSLKWSYGMTVAGILLGFIGWLNYETSAWGILAIVGVIIGAIGIAGYFTTRKKISAIESEIVVRKALLNDRKRR